MAVSLPVAAVLILLAVFRPAPASDPGQGPRPLARGLELLAAGKPDSALAPMLAAHTAGMPKDSLFYFLSEIARRKSAFDTAMGFNLAIGTPGPGPFRDSVLAQRYRLFAVSGLAADAAALRDSLAALPDSGAEADGTPEPKRRVAARLGTGWFRESNHSAFAYPFGLDLGGYDPRGLQHRARGLLEFPIASGSRAAWSGGFEMQALKSYAKDSVDYRAGASLRAGRPAGDGWSAGLAAEGGRITGSGWVAGCKAEAGWLSLRSGGLALITGGVASEWDGQGRDRFQSAWLTGYADWTARTGRGFTAMLSFSGLRMDPILETASFGELYVDDVAKARPVHYQDASYSDSIPSTGRATFARYVSAAGAVRAGSRAPQSALIAAPTLGYSLPLGAGVTADATVALSGSWYPQAYRWDFAPLPQGSTATGDFAGFARNRADGKDYAVYLIQGNGGFTEAYGAAPLERRAKTRMDGQADVELGLRRGFKGWGALAATAGARRNASTLEGSAPIWITAWSAGAALKWSGEWKW